MRELAQPPSYDPYYLHQSRQQPPEYYYPHETINPNFTYSHHPIHDPISNPPISTTIPIHITKEQRHINTLFVSGLPDDVMPREIHNLFRRRPGFDSCQLKFTGRGNQVCTFLIFLIFFFWGLLFCLFNCDFGVSVSSYECN